MEFRAKICISYIITATLITCFVYSFVATHFSSINKLERLQSDVESITKIILGRNPKEALLPQIDAYVKKRTQGLWNELIDIKKQLITGTIGGSCGFSKVPSRDVELIIQEEPNYALELMGASVVHVDDDPYHPTRWWYSIFGIKHGSNFPKNILDPSMQLGSCYAFKGSVSQVTIKLTHRIFIRSITVEHISITVSLTADISNAPKDFLVYGLESSSEAGVFLGSFQYNNSLNRRAQTFHLDNENSFKLCKIKVTSNYGNPNQTCIYRVAIHGKLE